MNLKAKFVFSIGLMGLLCLTWPGLLQADTVYTYTGNAYDFCEYGYTCTGTNPVQSFTLDTTLTGPQVDNLNIGTITGGDLSGFVSSFSFSDGAGVNLTQATAGFWYFDVTTGPSGAINAWVIQESSDPSLYALNDAAASVDNNLNCSNESCGVTDVSAVQVNGLFYFDYGQNTANPGTWTISTTPEPSTLLLLGSGLLGMIGVARRKWLT